MHDEALCRAAYEAMYRAMVAKDLRALEALLSEGFTLVHMTGMLQDKAAFLQALADSKLNYRACQHEQISVQVRSDEARLIGRSRVSAAVFGGSWRTWPLQLDIRLIRHDQIWRIANAKASTY